jgi:hypothetical protein
MNTVRFAAGDYRKGIRAFREKRPVELEDLKERIP